MRSGATIRKVAEPRRQGVHAVGNLSGGSHGTGTKPEMQDKQKNQCYVCKEIHYVDQCPRFKSMSPKERWEMVKEQRACFSCLKRSKGHTASNCLRKRECQEKKQDGSICKRPHHKLLHDNAISDQGNVVGSIQDNSEAILPVISATIKCSNNVNKLVRVFYDSGAQVSMIREALAEELELESKPVTILIATVGDTEQELNTKLYKVPICTSDGKPVQTIEAVGIPQILQDNATIDISHLSQLFRLPKNAFHRKPGPIDVLVGINYPSFHTGRQR